MQPGATVNFEVDWGDGNTDTITSWNQAETTHAYAAPGTFTVTMTGTITGFGFGIDTGSGNTAADKLLDVQQWGDVVLRNDGGAFMDADNLTAFSATDEPDLITVTNLESTFRSADLFNRDIGSWDTSSVTNMNSMFNGTSAFNQDLALWCVSRIGALPINFDAGATSWALPRPAWGTCP